MKSSKVARADSRFVCFVPSWIHGPGGPTETRPSGGQKRSWRDGRRGRRHVSANCNQQVLALLRQPSWRLVRSLAWVTDDDATTRQLLADLASDPNARHLRRLLLDPLSDEPLKGPRLLTCFPNLKTLSVALGCDNGRKTVLRFLGSGLPSSLQGLELTGAEHLDDGMSDDVPDVIDAIASSPVIRRLRAISMPNMSELTLDRFLERFRGPLSHIGHQEWTLESIERLCRNRELASGLKRLDLLGANLGDEGASLLARCPHFAGLESLNLGSNAIGPEGLSALAGSSILPNLKWLNLFDNPLGDDGWEILSRSPLRRLKGLDLWWIGRDCGSAPITCAGRRSAPPATLDPGGQSRAGGRGHLSYPEGTVRDEIVEAQRRQYGEIRRDGRSAGLATPRVPQGARSRLGRWWRGVRLSTRASSVFPSLMSPDLRGLGLGDEGVEHLTRSRGFPRLRRLSLWGNGITSRGVRPGRVSLRVVAPRPLATE